MRSAPSAPPSAASPLPSANVKVKSRPVLMPDRLRHRAVVHRRAHHRAPARALEADPQHRDEDRARNDDDHAVGRERAPEELGLALHEIRQRRGERVRPVREPRDRDRDEDQADREQHLLELAGGVEPRVQQPLEHHAPERHHDAGDDERREPGHPEPRHRGDHQVAPGHREHAVGEVDEAHQAHRDRQADRDRVQDHPVREAVERDADEAGEERFQGRPSSPLPRRIGEAG